jgi:hypothetical protein
LWRSINQVLVMLVRELEGREAGHTACVIVKTTESGGPKGYDTGKRIKNRKPYPDRHPRLDDRSGRPYG